MITEQALQEAIAECNGKPNPDANTCIKLASYYTIRDQLYPQKPEVHDAPASRDMPTYSYAADLDMIRYEGDSEFALAVNERSVSHIMPIIDEMMGTVKMLYPRLYDAVMRRIMDK